MRPSLTSNPSRRGASLIEVLIVSSMLAGAVGMFVESMRTTTNVAARMSVVVEARSATSRAMRTVTQVLRPAAFATVGTSSYPQLPLADEAEDAGGAFEHDAPAAVDGDLDPATMRDAIFVLPADDDGDGWPDTDASQSAVYDPLEWALLVVPDDDDGLNQVELRNADGLRRVLARGVSYFSVEGPTETGFAIPLGSVRVTVEVQRSGVGGEPVRHRLRETVSLVNGELGE